MEKSKIYLAVTSGCYADGAKPCVNIELFDDKDRAISYLKGNYESQLKLEGGGVKHHIEYDEKDYPPTMPIQVFSGKHVFSSVTVSEFKNDKCLMVRTVYEQTLNK